MLSKFSICRESPEAKGSLPRCSESFIKELEKALKVPAKERLFSMDTFVQHYRVLGKKRKGEPRAITLIERKTKKLLTKKIWKRDAKSVKSAVLKMVLKEEKERFKTITTDNGSEFTDLAPSRKS